MSCIIRINCLYKKNHHYENKFKFNVLKDDEGKEYVGCVSSDIINRKIGEDIIECAKAFNAINRDLRDNYTPKFSISLNKISLKCSCSCKDKFRSFPYESLEDSTELKCILCGNTVSHEDYLRIRECCIKLQNINKELQENSEYTISVEMSYRPDNASICAHDFKEGKDLKFHHLFLIEYN